VLKLFLRSGLVDHSVAAWSRLPAKPRPTIVSAFQG